MSGWMGYSGASTARSRDDRALQNVSGLLWESVARVAHGVSPDAEDRSAIGRARSILDGQRTLLDFVEGRAAAPISIAEARGTSTFVDLIWVSADELGFNEVLDASGSDGIGLVVQALDGVSAGDRSAAKKWEPLFGRVAMLVESAGGGGFLFR